MMATWHGYILYEKHTSLTAEEWDICITSIEAVLNDFPFAPQPAHILHWRISLDGEKAIYEALFDEGKLVPGTLNAAIVLYALETLGKEISIGVVARNNLTVWENGKSWEESRQACVSYLSANINEWE